MFVPHEQCIYHTNRSNNTDTISLDITLTIKISKGPGKIRMNDCLPVLLKHKNTQTIVKNVNVTYENMCISYLKLLVLI